MQYEMNKAANGFAQAAGGYYAYEATPEQVAAGDWGSVFGAAPRVFGMTYGNGEDHSMFTANMTTHQPRQQLQPGILRQLQLRPRRCTGQPRHERRSG